MKGCAAQSSSASCGLEVWKHHPEQAWKHGVVILPAAKTWMNFPPLNTTFNFTLSWAPEAVLLQSRAWTFSIHVQSCPSLDRNKQLQVSAFWIFCSSFSLGKVGGKFYSYLLDWYAGCSSEGRGFEPLRLRREINSILLPLGLYIWGKKKTKNKPPPPCPPQK